MESQLRRLKKNWKNKKYLKYNIEFSELSNFLNLKSKSILKRILLVNILEFCLSIVSIIIINQKNISQNNSILTYTNYLYYFIFIYFFIRFFINLKKIDLTLNLKDLSEIILKTRKSVYNYICLNIILFNLNVIILFYQYLCSSQVDINRYLADNLILYQIFIFILIAILSTIISFFIWLIYKAFYLKMIDRLHQNLQDLND